MAEDVAAESVVTPPVEVVAADPVDALIPGESASIKEHAAAFGKLDPSLEGDERKAAEETRQKIRHRARSGEATTEDVPRINKLTKDLRASQARIAELEAAAQQRSTNEPAPLKPVGRAPDVEQPKIEPTRPKPTEDEIGSKYKLYSDYVEDLTDWKYEQRDAARVQQDQQRQHTETATQAEREWQAAHQKYATRAEAFSAITPDFKEVLAQHGNVNVPPAAVVAILQHDNGPAFVYHLLTHLDQLAEMGFLMGGKEPTTENVAHATRWLSSRTQAAQTGSAASTPAVTTAPRPPNPVRTGTTRTDATLGENASIRDHAAVFGKGAQRRR